MIDSYAPVLKPSAVTETSIRCTPRPLGFHVNAVLGRGGVPWQLDVAISAVAPPTGSTSVLGGNGRSKVVVGVCVVVAPVALVPTVDGATSVEVVVEALELTGDDVVVDALPVAPPPHPPNRAIAATAAIRFTQCR